jgi:hypothetical protein
VPLAWQMEHNLHANRSFKIPKGLSGAEIEDEQTKTTWSKIILFEEGVVVSFQHQITQSKYIIVFLWQYTFLVIGHIPMVLLFKTCSLREKYLSTTNIVMHDFKFIHSRFTTIC